MSMLLLLKLLLCDLHAIEFRQLANLCKYISGIPDDVTHVYTRQHKALGLQSPYAGPFKIEQRLSRSTIKICVGNKVSGEPIYEVRHLNDIKICDPNSYVSPATRPKKGRPSKVPEPSAQIKKSPAPETTAGQATTTISGKQPHPNYAKKGPIITEEMFQKWAPDHFNIPENNSVATIQFNVPPPNWSSPLNP